MSKPVTLADVAREAGVAVGTASRVINNLPNVNSETYRRVLDVVARLRYQRLRRRRSAAGAKERVEEGTANIGVVLLGMDDTLIHVPILSEVLHGVESTVTRINGNLLFANLPNADKVPAFLSGNQVDGLIVKTSQYNELPDPETNRLVKSMLRLPIVWIWERPKGAQGDVCSYNHETAAGLAAGHLAEHGHKIVAFLNPKKGKSSLEHLKKEFQFACARRGMKLTIFESSSAHIATWPEAALSGPADVLPLVDEWLALDRPRRPTAIFAPADNMAMHINAAIVQRGLRVGRDVSLISVNNEKSLISAMSPQLTTIDVHAHAIGVRSVEQLLWRIRHPEDRGDQSILLEPELVEGKSVARV